MFDAGLVDSISPGKGIYYGTLSRPHSAALSFLPEGVTGTSCYRFDNLHLIKIPSHADRERKKSANSFITNQFIGFDQPG